MTAFFVTYMLCLSLQWGDSDAWRKTAMIENAKPCHQPPLVIGGQGGDTRSVNQEVTCNSTFCKSPQSGGYISVLGVPNTVDLCLESYDG